MTSAATPPTFAAVGKRALREAGLLGKTVQVTFAERALHLTGADGGTLRIGLDRAERLRLGYFHGKHRRAFAASIWLVGQDKPLVLEPGAYDALGYGAAMRGFAQALVAARGIASIERGVGGATALFMLAFVLLPPVAMGVLAVMFIDHVAARAVLFAAAVVLGFAGVRLYFKRQRPRPVASLADVEPQLPDPVTGA